MNLISKSIRVKLSISMGIAALCLILVYFANDALIRKLNQGVDTFGENYLPALSSILNADRDLYQAYTAQLQYLEIPKPEFKNDFVENAQQAYDRMNSYLEKMQAYPEIRDKLNAFDSSYSIWKTESERYFELIDGGKTTEAAKLLETNVSQKFSSLRDIYNLAGELLDEKSKNRTATLQSVSAQFNTWISTIIILVIIVVGGLIFLVPKMFVHGITELSERIAEISHGDGDLTLRINSKRKDELGALAKSFDEFVDKLQSLVKEISGNTRDINENARQLSNAYQSNQNLNQEHSRGIELVATAVNEFSVSIKEVADSAQGVSSATEKTVELAHDGVDIIASSVNQTRELSVAMQEANSTIASLEDNSNSIATVLDVIRNIADQTNLLALNAAIEAARAGEQGRGFAVVADEVRALASKTQSSTEEIQHMIDKLQQGVKAAVTSVQNGAGKVEKNVELAEKTQAMFDSIQALTAEINDRAIQIAAATEEQTNVSEEISNNLVTLNDQNIRNLELANNVQEVANTANRLSTELKASVDHFKVN